MSTGAPYRESDVVDCVERTCPRCKALVFFATDDPSATCTACSQRPLPARRPRVPFIVEPEVPPDDSAEKRRLLNVIAVACLAACAAAFALGGVVIGAVTILASAGVLATANRARPALRGIDE